MSCDYSNIYYYVAIFVIVNIVLCALMFACLIIHRIQYTFKQLCFHAILLTLVLGLSAFYLVTFLPFSYTQLSRIYYGMLLGTAHWPILLLSRDRRLFHSKRADFFFNSRQMDLIFWVFLCGGFLVQILWFSSQ